MFRREIDGRVYRFEVAGLWGSGNTMTERELLWTSEHNIYSLWDGHALVGSRRPGSVQRYPALWGTLTLDEFLARYRGRDGVDCKYFTGEEILGVGCGPACARLAAMCPSLPEAQCLDQCARLPRSSVDCLAHIDTCDPRSCTQGSRPWLRERIRGALP